MKILETEIWKDIPNYEGIYQASNLGRIRSLPRQTNNQFGKKERILKPKLTHNGYYQVALFKNSNGKFYLVHRLVWIAFNGQIPEGYEINHLDERPVNNALSNLSLVTHKENLNWGTRNERSAKSLSKTVLQFTIEGIFIKEYPSLMQVERELGFSRGVICDCCKAKRKTAYNYIWKYKENKKGED